MTKKRMVLIAVLPLTVAVIVGALAMLPPSPGVTEDNVKRIQKGMAESEVNEILGTSKTFHEAFTGPSYTCWHGKDGNAFVGFDERGGVEYAYWNGLHETTIDKIRRERPPPPSPVLRSGLAAWPKDQSSNVRIGLGRRQL